ncbi:MAG TPA: ABC transporter ATP-binding protein, partial [Anaerolineae bacterium]
MSSLLTASIESFGYPGAGAPLFRDIHLSLQAGDLLLVSGPGGCGKSAFCYCLANVIPGFYTAGDLRGSVAIDGVRVTGMPLAQSARYVGLLLQAPERHLCHLSVGEDIAFGPENRAQPPSAIAQTVADLAGRLELGHLLARSPHTLSAGESQRAALAATLALDPPVLVFDQPTAHLDTRARQAFYQLVARLCREEGKILVIAETDQRRDDLEALATQRLDLAGSERFPFLG